MVTCCRPGDDKWFNAVQKAKSTIERERFAERLGFKFGKTIVHLSLIYISDLISSNGIQHSWPGMGTAPSISSHICLFHLQKNATGLCHIKIKCIFNTHGLPQHHRVQCFSRVFPVLFLYGGFHSHGGTQKWMVDCMENPIWKWMITRGTPISGNHHMSMEGMKSPCQIPLF